MERSSEMRLVWIQETLEHLFEHARLALLDLLSLDAELGQHPDLLEVVPDPSQILRATQKGRC